MVFGIYIKPHLQVFHWYPLCDRIYSGAVTDPKLLKTKCLYIESYTSHKHTHIPKLGKCIGNLLQTKSKGVLLGE